MADQPKSKPPSLIALAFLALFGSYFFFAILLVSYSILTFTGFAIFPDDISQIINFSAPMLVFTLIGLGAGIVLGRIYPYRAAWLPLLLLLLPPILLLREQFALRHLLFLPGAVIIGWGLAAYGKRRKKPWLPLALAALGILSGLALLVGNADRIWLLQQSSAALRHLGADPKRPSHIEVMDFKPLPFPGGLYASVIFDERIDKKTGTWRQARFYLDSFDFRRRKLDNIFVERRIDQSEVFPETLAEAKALGRRFNVPESFLAKLEARKYSSYATVEGEKQTFEGTNFLAGPKIGTWDSPHLEISSQILLQIGEPPH